MTDERLDEEMMPEDEAAEETTPAASDAGYEEVEGPEHFDPDVTLSEEEEAAREAVQEADDGAEWYVIHTYSGYENKVKTTLEQITENRNIHDMIQEVSVPEEEIIEIKDGKKKTVKRKIYPGYVLVKMVLTDEIWYIVRNTRGVTGFVGPSSKPVPLTDEELAIMGMKSDWEPIIDYGIGDSVKIINGPLESFIGVVDDINHEKKKVRVMVSMFGRETPVELDFTQVLHI